MKEISSLSSLHEALKASDKIWLLLYKKGAPLSDCAIKNFEEVASRIEGPFLCTADVNSAKDIHSEYGIDTVPTLMMFTQNGLRKVIKGCHQPEQFETFINEKTATGNATASDKASKKVVVYTTPTCSWCTAVKRHLDANGIAYREINVAADAKAAEAMVQKSGQQGVPQTEINGQIVVGFDKSKINSLLGIN